jgi:hypothetical protein
MVRGSSNCALTVNIAISNIDHVDSCANDVVCQRRKRKQTMQLNNEIELNLFVSMNNSRTSQSIDVNNEIDVVVIELQSNMNRCLPCELGRFVSESFIIEWKAMATCLCHIFLAWFSLDDKVPNDARQTNSNELFDIANFHFFPSVFVSRLLRYRCDIDECETLSHRNQTFAYSQEKHTRKRTRLVNKRQCLIDRAYPLTDDSQYDCPWIVLIDWDRKWTMNEQIVTKHECVRIYGWIVPSSNVIR